MLIDTHCHLNFKAFKKNVDEIIKQAKQAGVEKIIVPGTNLKTSKKAVELAQKYKGIYAAIGIHPHHSSTQCPVPNILYEFKKLAKSKKVVAIGECGLDYYQYQKTKYKNYKIDQGFKKIQKEIFEKQIQLANKLNLPLIIHNRQASNDILKLIENWRLRIENLSGVFHCFQGNFNLLNWALKHQFYIGITGIVTYDKQMQKIVKKIPLERLLIETDSPFLTPEPLRSKKIFPNTPVNVRIVAEWIAQIKGDSFLNVIKQTTKNAVQLFKLIAN